MKKGDAMKKFGLLTTLAVFCVLFAFGPRQARAGTITLELTGAGPGSAGGYYIYPYDFTIKNGGTTIGTDIPLMCMSFDQEIYMGESWTIEEYTAAYEDALNSTTQYEEAAYFYSLAAAAPNGSDAAINAQWAAWHLSDPSGVSMTAPDGDSISSLLSTAAIDASLYANYDIYVPVPGSEVPSTDGLPQTFVGYGEPPYDVTPEPSAFILLATGLLGLASVLYFKKRGLPAAAQF
jgi:hypothetical protein